MYEYLVRVQNVSLKSRGKAPVFSHRSIAGGRHCAGGDKSVPNIVPVTDLKKNIRKRYRKVGQITLKCDYLLNMRTFCVFFQRKFVTL